SAPAAPPAAGGPAVPAGARGGLRRGPGAPRRLAPGGDPPTARGAAAPAAPAPTPGAAAGPGPAETSSLYDGPF
ncbi:MAG: pyruvate dehydrogenase complex dihydrolipoyllysine-residue acetyltransferase, partial [Deltaproteobacteria bacterium]|nr:pyruvate dehydrogenase complex dihydrolipoyllysine-residue acetyltransferase [Deltaproteobacteria bacterium]